MLWTVVLDKLVDLPKSSSELMKQARKSAAARYWWVADNVAGGMHPTAQWDSSCDRETVADWTLLPDN